MTGSSALKRTVSEAVSSSMEINSTTGGTVSGINSKWATMRMSLSSLIRITAFCPWASPLQAENLHPSAGRAVRSASSPLRKSEVSGETFTSPSPRVSMTSITKAGGFGSIPGSSEGATELLVRQLCRNKTGNHRPKTCFIPPTPFPEFCRWTWIWHESRRYPMPKGLCHRHTFLPEPVCP